LSLCETTASPADLFIPFLLSHLATCTGQRKAPAKTAPSKAERQRKAAAAKAETIRVQAGLVTHLHKDTTADDLLECDFCWPWILEFTASEDAEKIVTAAAEAKAVAEAAAFRAQRPSRTKRSVKRDYCDV
jgi:hypothetical protein